MTDVFSKKKRSQIMSKIRSKGTKLDIRMYEILKTEKISFIQYPKIYGHPDFLVEDSIVLFCDSSFWHGKNWKILKKRLSNGNNPSYWIQHISKNRKRDKEVSREMACQGYTVLRFWDEDVFKRPEWCIIEIKNHLKRKRESQTNVLQPE